MEPERPIEKALRAAAQQRRREAGAASELHPATRRLLQGEVTRRYGQQQSAGLWLAHLLARRRPLVWALGSVAVAGIVIALVIPSMLQGPKPNGAMARLEATPPAVAPPSSPVVAAELAAKETRQAMDDAKAKPERDFTAGAAAVRGPAVENAPAAAAAKLAMTESERDRKSADSMAALSARVSRTVAAAPTLGAPATDSSVALRRSMATTNVGNALAAIGLPASGVRQFARVDALSTKLEPTDIEAAAPVLRSFELTQNGSELRIVDADGSIYEGAFGSGGLPAAAGPAARTHAAPSSADASFAKRTGGGAGEGSLSFSVTGTNRTLKARVMLTGVLAASTNSAAAKTRTAPAGGSAPPASTTIRGKLAVGDNPAKDFEARTAPGP